MPENKEHRGEKMRNGVVIVTYNRLSLLKGCLACAAGQTLPFSEIIIVDNCSTDGTGEYLDAFAAEAKDADVPACRVTVFHEKENLGGAGGFYRGMEAARSMDLDWLLIIDDDAMIRPDYMEILTDYGRAHSSVQALAGSVFVDGAIHTMHRRNVTSRLLFVESNIPETEYEKESFSCDCATFCGLLIRGSVMEQVGLPKREYFIWYDDSEYSLRLQELGGIVCVPAAVLDHKTVIPKETEGLLERTSWRHYYGYRNRYDTARQHFGRLSAACIALEYHVLSLLSRLMLVKKESRDKGLFNVKMIHDALSDARAGRLGRREEYHP